MTMMRFLTALTAGLLGVGVFAAPQPPTPKVQIRWHGQSFFEIRSSKGTCVVIDPHNIEPYGKKAVPADLVLITHLHTDHVHVAAATVPGRPKPRVHIGLTQMGRRQDWNPIDETFRDIRIRSLGAYHDTLKGLERGKVLMYILDVDGLRLVHLGDLAHPLSDTGLRLLGTVDVLMIPVGGVYTLNGSEAKKVVEQIKPRRYILPMHYGTVVYDDVLPVDEFLEDQKNVKKFATNLLTIDPSQKPTEPIIALLSWK